MRALAVVMLLADTPAAGRVVPMTVPSAQLAVTVHAGKHTDIDVTYGRLAGWVLAQGFTIGGPVRETYLVGPRDTPDVDPWRTEIGWPVVKS
ncbi:MAG: GyrI-like domain-containing protein [Nakamurella sp.]